MQLALDLAQIGGGGGALDVRLNKERLGMISAERKR